MHIHAPTHAVVKVGQAIDLRDLKVGQAIELGDLKVGQARNLQ